MLTLIAIGTCAGGALVFMAVVQLIMSRVLKYRLDGEGLSIVMLGRVRPLRRVAYRDMSGVVLISWLDFFREYAQAGFQVRWWTNRTLTRNLVAVSHRDGREFMVTPDHPDVFVREINERLTHVLNEGVEGPARRR